MKFRIAMDSCGELSEEMKSREEFASVPLTLMINGEEIIDDGHLTTKELTDKIAADPDCPKTACPSPEAFRSAYDAGAEHIYAVTLSAELSGSYQSAVIGMNMYLEEHPDAKIHVFNSRGASVGETLMARMIAELEDAGTPFEEIVEKVEEYGRKKTLLFVLDNLETLRKNGRLSKMKALAASVLKIKPVCYATAEGTIGQLDQARGINKALQKMVGHAIDRTPDPENRVLAISYVNCRERAEMVRDAILERIRVKDVFLTETRGVSTVYANDGGIILVI
jgi:DegV family protein with EDD domain